MMIKTGYLSRLTIGLALCLTLCVVWPTTVAAEVTIVLKSQASVDEDKFILNQIATVTGSVPQQVTDLSGLIMGNSPLPGRSLRIYPSHIEQKLKQSGIDLSQCQLVAQGPVEVQRRSVTLSLKQIETSLRSFIHNNAPWQREQIKIRPIRYRQKHKLPPGKIDLQVSAPKHTDWLGAETFSMNILVNHGVVKRINVPAFIEVWSDIALSAKPLGRGQPIGPEDIVIQKMDLARAPSNALINPDQIIGYTAKRSIAVNTILCSNQFESPAVIRRGDIVRVVAESGHLKISTKAVARENGGLGERIELMNLQSKKKIVARVVDGQTVQVHF